jgi:uncharacterized protein (TIGR02301 family)
MSLRALALSATAFGVAAFGALPAHAQQGPGPTVETLSELADVLGRAHAIRSMCNGEDDQTWRTYMFNMLAIEAPSGSPMKAPLTSAFNRGFRTQRGRSDRCTPDMPKLEAELAARGRALTEVVVASYLH